jgi:hypothetical protein
MMHTCMFWLIIFLNRYFLNWAEMSTIWAADDHEWRKLPILTFFFQFEYRISIRNRSTFI